MALPKVRVLLRNMAECEEFRQATRGGVRDVRMGAQELCLRYLTILSAYDWDKRDFCQYHGSLPNGFMAAGDGNEEDRRRFCRHGYKGNVHRKI